MSIIKHNWDWTHGLSKRQETDTIVIHHAAAENASPEAVHDWHKHNGWAGIGYHFYIRKDGSIHEGRPLWASGANVLNHNWHTIGVCCEGNYDVAGAVMPKAQMDALHEAIRYMKKLYPKAAVKFHRDYGGSVCPGRYFPAKEALDYEEKPAPVPVPTPAPVEPAEREDEGMQRFKTVDELPAWAQADIQKLIDKGLLRGKGEVAGLDLTEDMARVLIVCGRMQGVL
jgi:hypothetical protein